MPRFIFLKSPDVKREEEKLSHSPAETFDPTSLQQAAAHDGHAEQQQKAVEKNQIDSIREQLKAPVETKNEDISALESDPHDSDGTKLMEKVFKLKNSPEKTERSLKILEWMIETGRGSPVNIMSFACRAVSEGIFSTNEIKALEQKSNQFPPIAFLAEFQKDPHLSDMVQKMDESTFKNFYWTKIISHNQVVERTEKAMVSPEIDHDHIGFIGPVVSLDATKNFLTAKSTKTAIHNFYAGTIMALEENIDDQDAAVDFLGKFLVTERYLGGMDKKSWRERPRIAGATNHPKKTVAELTKMMWKALEKLDKKLARFLQSKDMNIFDINDHLKKEYGLEINSVSEIYDQIQSIVRKMVGRKSSSFFGKTGWADFQKKLS